jgi:signal transduction histidine kinase
VAAALLSAGAAAVVVRRRGLALGCWVVSAGLLVLAAGVPTGAGPGTTFAAEAVAPLLPAAAALTLAHRPAAAGGWSRYAVWLAAAVALVAGPMRAISYDPFRDITCSIGCGPNPWAVISLGPSMHQWLAYPAMAIPALLAVAALLGRDLVLALLALLASVALTRDVADAGMLLAGAVIGAGLALVVGADAGQVLASRARVRDLADALASGTDAEATLRRELGLPELRVVYTLSGRHAGEGVSVQLGGGVQAWVDPGDGAVSRALLESAMRGPARLAMENGALRLEVAARAAEVEESRRRVVARAEQERHRLERDLHDGAQQLVLALGVELRDRAVSAPEPDRQLLLEGVETVRQVLDDLRSLAYDLHPSGLGPHDLGEVLLAAADGCPGDVRVVCEVTRSVPPGLEYAVGLLVRGLRLADAPVVVRVADARDGLAIELTGAADVPRDVQDVFAVLGGGIDRARSGENQWSGWMPLAMDAEEVEVR